ncbi:MAG: hydantoinase/oxoprolinase family protein [Dehalococcoidia bacterium]|jgi:N-methylhydantoinase A|nr:hydantoinase/oxoprolinase family protein [Dehalococcoidia bacterium]
MRTFRIGVDVGGTFTDGTLVDSSTGTVITSKVLSTPSDPSIGFIEAVNKLLGMEGSPSPQDIEHVVHATTVATNAIIEGKTAKTAFITTEGFRDMLEIARQIRPSLYDLQFEKPKPLVQRQLCFEVPERLDAKGSIIKPLDDEAVKNVVDQIAKLDVEAVAVCLLHSYRNSDHENRVGKILKSKLPNLAISLSSNVVPEFREYFRASTTVINSAVAPLVGKYLTSITRKLKESGIRGDLLVMQSSGGVYSVESAVSSPVFMVESGPAAGAVAAANLGSSLGFPNIISLDMGGTTAKASLVQNGRLNVTKDYSVGDMSKTGSGAFGGASGYPIRTPVVDLVEIGAGGGSIAWVDSGGALRVGPHSAGADPGPVCYGGGGIQPTITDANLVLGRLDPQYFAGGEIILDLDRARAAIDKYCAKPLGLSIEGAGFGIIEIANTAMVNALRLVSVQRGHDPRDFMLIAFGGAGPAHAVRLAEQAGIPRVLIPLAPGTASALGLLATDVRMERSSSLIVRSDSIDLSVIADEFKRLEGEGIKAHKSAASSSAPPFFERAVEMRYWGQSFELNLPTPKEKTVNDVWLNKLIESFHKAHEKTYGFRADNELIEIVNLRVTTVGKITRPRMKELEKKGGDVSIALKGTREVYFDEQGGMLETPVYNRESLNAGMIFSGPGIIEESDSTTVIPPGWMAEVDNFGNLTLKSEQ